MPAAINEFADVTSRAAHDVAAEGAKAARRLLDEGKTVAKNHVDSSIAFVEEKITAHPARGAAIAVGLGFVLGLLLTRRG